MIEDALETIATTTVALAVDEADDVATVAAVAMLATSRRETVAGVVGLLSLLDHAVMEVEASSEADDRHKGLPSLGVGVSMSSRPSLSSVRVARSLSATSRCALTRLASDRTR